MITSDSLSAVLLRGEACVTAAQGDGVWSSWSRALHCVQCDGADHCQTAAGYGQFFSEVVLFDFASVSFQAYKTSPLPHFRSQLPLVEIPTFCARRRSLC